MNVVNAFMAVVLMYGLMNLAFTISSGDSLDSISLLFICLGLGHFIAIYFGKDRD